MLHKVITIKNRLGFHTHACVTWVQLARYFISEIILVYNGHQVDGKSIVGVMSLTVRRGAPLEVIIQGEDELEALKALEKLINDRFQIPSRLS